MLTEDTSSSLPLGLGFSFNAPTDLSKFSINSNPEESMSSIALYRNLSLDVLANDFLNLFTTTDFNGSSDGGAILDARLYFIERLFPTLVIALEKLLIKLQRPSNVCFSMSSSIQQLDHLPVTFNPILWLAHYLFRHAHSDDSLTSNSVYFKKLNEVAKTLKHRVTNLQEIRISHLKAENEARRLELDTQRKLKAMLLERKRSHIQEKCKAILRKLPKILQFHHSVFYADMLASCQCILNSSLLKDSPEKKSVIQQFHDDILQKNHSLNVSDSLSNGSHTSLLQPLSTAITLESMVDFLLPWTDPNIDCLFSTYQSWMVSEEDRMAKVEVDLFLNQWKNTGLSLHQALHLSLLTSQDLLPETLVEEIQAIVQQTDAMEEPLQLELFTKIAKTNAKTLAELYPTFLSHPEYKEQLCIPPLTNLASTPTTVVSEKSEDASISIVNTTETVPLEKPDPNIDLVLLTRKEEIQNMITAWCQTWKEEALKTHILNSVISLSSQNVLQNLALSDHLLQNKLPIPLNAYLTHTVASSEYLTDYFIRKWKSLNDTDFLAAINAFNQASITTFNEYHPSQTSTTFATRNGKEDITSSSTSQSSQADTNQSSSPLVAPDYATACLSALTPLIENFPPQVRIHIAFKNSTSAESLYDPDEKTFGGFTVMSSNDPRAIGTKLEGELFEHLLSSKFNSEPTSSNSLGMELPQPQLVTEIQPGQFEAWTPSTSSDTLGYAVMVPIQTLSGTVGVIYVDALQHVAMTKTFTTTQDLHFFLKSHVEALHQASQSLGNQLELVDKLNQMMIVAQSSVSFLREQVQADPHFYLVQNDRLYSITFQDPETVPISSSTSASDLWQKFATPHTLALLTPTSSTQFLYECAQTQKTLTKDQETAVPILDPVTQQPMAVMVMASSLTNESLEKEDIEQVQKIAKVLGTALSTATKKKPLRKLGLAAEALENQGEFIFVTCMLDSLRESIRELDSSAIAELKSYKKPPPTIHKVLKCLCYLFGKTPKQVKLWSDTIKYINMEMLKQMLNYDSTAIQKKSIFIRIRKILKTIPHGDVRRKGSLPALTVYAWLLINLDLRDKAIKARRRASIRDGKVDAATIQEETMEMDEPLEEDPLEAEEEMET